MDRDTGVSYVEIYLGQSPTGIYLPVLDERLGVYGMADIPVGAGMEARQHMLELVAGNDNGNLSPLWPYLNVDE